MSNALQINLPGQPITIKTATVKTDVAQVVRILRSINASDK